MLCNVLKRTQARGKKPLILRERTRFRQSKYADRRVNESGTRPWS